ncbi:MAG TPA: dTMP kinase [Sphingomicrobium sp.]|nr:dTMP kinase [Sphingomicrobium sp.]
MRGKFITLEGGEGVGKSTQVEALGRALRERGIDVLVTREPGGSEGAEKIRELLLGGAEERWGARAEALLFAAARSDHVTKTIRPALDEGKWVVSDRFLDSSLAYQGGAGGLGIEAVREINDFGLEGYYPDTSLILMLDDGGDRARSRDNGASDRIGGRPDEYHRKVDAAFHIIAAEEPERVQLVDATGSPEEVTQRLLKAIEDLLP